MRNRYTALVVFFLLFGILPGASWCKPNGTQIGNIRMYLYETGTGTENTGKNMIYATLGDTITVDVFLRNQQQENVTGLDIYFSVDDRYFSIASQGKNAKGSMRPFKKGQFMVYAQDPEPFDPVGNYTHGDSLTANDNGIPKWQLDYVIISPPDIGSGRPSSNLRYGTACSFKVIAKAPGDSIPILLDDDHYTGRFARYAIKNANETYYFRSFQTCYITVTGIEINPPLPDISMLPGGENTSLDLDAHVEVSSVPDSLLTWTAKGNKKISVAIDPKTHVVTFKAPSDFRGYEDITFTVSGGGGIQASDVMRVTVNSPPHIIRTAIPDTIRIHEDTREPVLALRTIVEDVDDDFSVLKWTFHAVSGNLKATTVSDTLFLKGIQDYYGLESLEIKVTDDLGISDSYTVPVRVLPVNDPPIMNKLPDIAIRRGEAYTLDFNLYASDADRDPLTITWTASKNLALSKSGMKVDIASADGFVGSENVLFTVTDPGGLFAADTLMVTVNPATKPPVWTKIPKIGFPQGKADSSLVIWNYVSDPDDQDNMLTFVFANTDNVDSVFVNPRTGRVTFYDRDNAAGWDRVTVTAFDPDGNKATTQFPVFIGPSDGTPIVAGIPDTTIVSDAKTSSWIDLDDFYYDVDNTDAQMKWTWGRQAGADSSATVTISALSHMVALRGLGAEKYGTNRVFFTVTDPTGKFGDDICIITTVAQNKPMLDLPRKVGFVAGSKFVLDLDDYAQDGVYARKDLLWQWTGIQNVTIAFVTPDEVQTRPVAFSGSSGWTGWERAAFEVKNPLGGAARDTVLVFSVPADGSPVAGGLGGISLKAGNCTQISLDDYFYDAESVDYQMTWTASGGDSVIVSIDSFTHVATVCAPSDTWEGVNTITFMVADPDGHTGSMQVPVTVTGAIIKYAFDIMLFRNPMQEDYIDVFVKNKIVISATPTVYVHLGTDSTKVTVNASGTDYYTGRYLLPLTTSLGTKGTASVTVRGATKDGKNVSNGKNFAYGRIGTSGAKLAVGGASLDIPSGTLDGSAFVTLIPETPDGSAAKSAGEVDLHGDIWRVGPSSLRTDRPMTIVLPFEGDAKGAGIYRIGANGPEFAGRSGDTGFTAGITSGGAYRVGYDLVPPRVKLLDTVNTVARVSFSDGGSGIDERSIRVNAGGTSLPFSYDKTNSRIDIDLTGLSDDDGFIDVAVADRSGNQAADRIAVGASARPFVLSVRQNVPNPFNPTTHISFAVSKNADTTVEVFDLVGRRIAVLADRPFKAGEHSLVWDARDADGRAVSSGTYLFRITAGGHSEARKMLLLR